MARNTKVAPTRRAAGHAHPRGVRRDASVARLGRDAVEREAHRTFLNWVGCAIGAARHPTVEAALAAVQELQPAPQATVLGRDERVDMASAALVNGIASHTFDFDDTHLKTIIHPAGPGRLGGARARRAHRRQRAAQLDRRAGARHRRRLPRRQRDLSRPLRPRLAHHRLDRHARRRRRRARACCGLDAQRTAMALGIAASQPIGVREQFGTDDQAVPSGRRGARGPHVRAAGASTASPRRPRALEAPRGLDADALDQVRLERDHRRARRALRDLVQHLQAVRLRHRDPSRASTAAMQLRKRTGCRADDIERIELRCTRWCSSSPARRSRGRPRGQVQRLPRLRGGLIFGRAGEDEFADDVVGARRRGRAARRVSSRRSTTRIDEASADVTIALQRRPPGARVRRARDRQPRAPDERCRARAQVPRPGRPDPRAPRAPTS